MQTVWKNLACRHSYTKKDFLNVNDTFCVSYIRHNSVQVAFPGHILHPRYLRFLLTIYQYSTYLYKSHRLHKNIEEIRKSENDPKKSVYMQRLTFSDGNYEAMEY